MTSQITKKDTLKTARVSEACKYFKDCPLNWSCLVEITLYGSAIWSLELCYDLIELEKSGLVEMNGNRIDERVAWGMHMLGKHDEIKGLTR